MRKNWLFLAALAGGLALSTASRATTCSAYPNALTNGTTADATQVMANFEAIRTCANTYLAPLAGPQFTGAVGIGTSTPIAALSVNGSTPTGVFSSLFGISYYPLALSTLTNAAASGSNTYINTVLSSKSNATVSTGATIGLYSEVFDPATVTVSQPVMTGLFSIAVHQGSGTVSTITGVLSLAENASATTVTNAYGLQGSARTITSSGAAITNAYGTMGSVYATVASSSITNARGLYAIISNNNASASMTTAAGLYIDNLVNTGTITTTYGIYIGSVTAGTQTNHAFSLYASDSASYNYFAGSVGIGTTAPAVALAVVGDIRVGTTGTNGCVQNFAGTALTGTCSSDRELKIVTGNVSGILERFAGLQLVRFRWNAKAAALYHNDMAVTNAGFVAQDVEAAFPELVTRDTHGYRQLDYSTLSLYGLEAVKELIAENDRKAQEIAGLKARLAADERDLTEIKRRLGIKLAGGTGLRAVAAR
jgi:hypothetical protein